MHMWCSTIWKCPSNVSPAFVWCTVCDLYDITHHLIIFRSYFYCCVFWLIIFSHRRFRICNIWCKLPLHFKRYVYSCWNISYVLHVCQKSLCTALWSYSSPQYVCASLAPGAVPQPLLIQLVVGLWGGSQASGEVAGRARAPPTGLKLSSTIQIYTKRNIFYILVQLTIYTLWFSICFL